MKVIIIFYKDNYFVYLDWAGGPSTLIKYYKCHSFVSYQNNFNFYEVLCIILAKMQFVWENLIRTIFIIFTAQKVFGTSESSLFEKGLQSYSRDCGNDTCNYKLTVDTEAITNTPPVAVDLTAEMSRLKVRAS